MKKILLSSLTIITIIFSAEAQTKRVVPDKTENTSTENGHEKHHKLQHHNMLAKTLNFTDAQKQQFKSISMDYKKQVTDLDKNNSNMSPEELKSKKQELMHQRMQKTMALLTPEQKAKMENLRKENREKQKNGSSKRIEKMQTDLGLTNEQVEKMKAQKEMLTSKRESIKNDQSLTMEQKKEQLKLLKDEKMNGLKSFLTPDQLKKMEEMRHKKSIKTA